MLEKELYFIRKAITPAGQAQSLFFDNFGESNKSFKAMAILPSEESVKDMRGILDSCIRKSGGVLRDLNTNSNTNPTFTTNQKQISNKHNRKSTKDNLSDSASRQSSSSSNKEQSSCSSSKEQNRRGENTNISSKRISKKSDDDSDPSSSSDGEDSSDNDSKDDVDEKKKDEEERMVIHRVGPSMPSSSQLASAQQAAEVRIVPYDG